MKLRRRIPSARQDKTCAPFTAPNQERTINTIRSVSPQNSDRGQSAVPRLLILAALAWGVFLCWAGRHEMLDDALIHLRYAAVLHDRHFISFDGIHQTYGASSLLYVGLLALLRSVTLSPLLPKIVSLIAYAGVVALALWIERANRLALALILVLVSPFAVRWLTDGMETSLACLLAIVFAALLYRRAKPIVLGSAALIMVLLRIDLTLLVAFGVLLLISRKDWLRAAYVCVGAGFSVAFIWLTMGHLLPDTAVAKEGIPFAAVLGTMAYEIVATFSFGTGLVLIWLASAAFALRLDRTSALICNLPFPVLALLAAAKGQQIHGVRYIVWALLFSIAWNLMASASAPKRYPVLLTVFACALVISWIFETPIALRVDRDRSESLLAMEQAHLDSLHGSGLAADVGYIGYFTRAPICDINGLINGRAAAQMSRAQRTQACLAAGPSFAFLSQDQLGVLNGFYRFNSQAEWLSCGSVVFENVHSDDRHWLLVRRSAYPGGCPTHL